MTSSPLLPLPPLSDLESLPAGVFARHTRESLDALAERLRPFRVLEIFAGNGFLAAQLHARGVDILATTRFSSHDAHSMGLYFPVEPLEARSAIAAHGPDRDLLLLCWPTADEGALRACELWGPARPIAYIGETTDYARHWLGGCASDAFFERFIPQIELPYQGNMIERAWLGALDEPSAALRPPISSREPSSRPR